MCVRAARWGRLERKARAHDRAREVIARGLGAIPDSFSLLLEAATLERVAGNHGTAREMAARADEASEPPRSSSLPQQILGALYGTTSPAFAPCLRLSLAFAITEVLGRILTAQSLKATLPLKLATRLTLARGVRMWVGMVERACGNTDAARAAFRTALRRDERCAGSAREWAVLESEAAQQLAEQVTTYESSSTRHSSVVPLCFCQNCRPWFGSADAAVLVAVAQAKEVQDKYQELRWAHDDLSEADPVADGAEAGEEDDYEDEELYRLRAPHPATPPSRGVASGRCCLSS